MSDGVIFGLIQTPTILYQLGHITPAHRFPFGEDKTLAQR